MSDLFCNLAFDTSNEIKLSLNAIHRRPYLDLKLQKSIATIGFYDTGADISCINAEIFFKILSSKRQEVRKEKKTETFCAANGGSLDVIGQFRVNVLVNGHSVDHEFYVIKGLNEPVILGIDFIERNEDRKSVV